MAGMVKMKAHTFQIANVASAFVWVAALVSPGYLANEGLSVLPSLDFGAIALVGLALVGIAGAVLLARRRISSARRAGRCRV